MFLFGVFLMFGILTIYGVSLSNIDVKGTTSEAAQVELETQLADATGECAQAQRQLALLNNQPGREDEVEALERQISGLDERIALLEIGQGGVEAFSEEVISDAVDREGNVVTGTQFINLSTGWERLDYGIQEIRENPHLALYKLQANFYKFS